MNGASTTRGISNGNDECAGTVLNTFYAHFKKCRNKYSTHFSSVQKKIFTTIVQLLLPHLL
jgi:hypothetical protein